MSNSHYYDRSSGKVVRRPESDSEGHLGNKAGYSHRKRDKTNGRYPAPGMPIRRRDRSKPWIDSYIKAYYQPHLGGVDLSDRDPVIEIDRELLEDIDILAEGWGMRRMGAISKLLSAFR